jgi:Protein of unknown function (DUF2628)
MAIYACHSPALDRGTASALESATVLRLGFAPWGFVFGPIWLLAKRLWLALGAWILGAAVVGLAVASGFLPPEAAVILYWLAALYVGIDGRSLQGWALARRGSPLADIVAAGSAESAEREFFARALAAPARGAASAGPAPSSAQEIIGLFPRAGR